MTLTYFYSPLPPSSPPMSPAKALLASVPRPPSLLTLATLLGWNPRHPCSLALSSSLRRCLFLESPPSPMLAARRACRCLLLVPLCTLTLAFLVPLLLSAPLPSIASSRSGVNMPSLVSTSCLFPDGHRSLIKKQLPLGPHLGSEASQSHVIEKKKKYWARCHKARAQLMTPPLSGCALSQLPLIRPQSPHLHCGRNSTHCLGCRLVETMNIAIVCQMNNALQVLVIVMLVPYFKRGRSWA